MKTYTYTGKTPIFVPNQGIIQPQERVTTSHAINHPDFKEVKGDTPPKADK